MTDGCCRPSCGTLLILSLQALQHASRQAIAPWHLHLELLLMTLTIGGGELSQRAAEEVKLAVEAEAVETVVAAADAAAAAAVAAAVAAATAARA